MVTQPGAAHTKGVSHKEAEREGGRAELTQEEAENDDYRMSSTSEGDRKRVRA